MVEVATYCASDRCSGKGWIMNVETPQVELKRLHKDQMKARQDEVFGGFSSSERRVYDKRQSRIEELEHHLDDIGQGYLRALKHFWDDLDQVHK
jgi:hypothetical protein